MLGEELSQRMIYRDIKIIQQVDWNVRYFTPMLILLPHQSNWGSMYSSVLIIIILLVWRLINIDGNKATLLAEHVIASKTFDGAEADGMMRSGRAGFGSNRW